MLQPSAPSFYLYHVDSRQRLFRGIISSGQSNVVRFKERAHFAFMICRGNKGYGSTTVGA